MDKKLTWDEAKRAANLAKHGLDFAHADLVLESNYRLDVIAERGTEVRVTSYSYVADFLAVLMVVHTERNKTARIISFRRASVVERRKYYEWLD